MSKGYKIKRYKRIYQTRHSKSSVLVRSLGALFAVCVLGFIGWSAYNPIVEYLSALQFPQAVPASANVEVPDSSAPEDTSLPAAQESSDSDKPPQSEPAAQAAPIKAIYLPIPIISDQARLDETLSKLDRSEINAVLFDLKDTAGNLLYQSQLELVKQAESQAANAFDLSALCKKLESNHILPIGRLNVFRDPQAASHLPEAAIKYMNSDFLWLDNAPNAGGKPWLNPYSELAQAYITDIATEASALGAKHILFDNLSFPSGYGQEYATYGSNAVNVTRSDVLSSFVDVLDTQIASLGGTAHIYISGPAALGAQNSYYGSNPLALANDNIILGVMPAQFGDLFTLESFSLNAPVLQPMETVDSLLKFLAPDLSGKKVTAMLQAYNAPYTVTNNKPYTAEDINAQIAALAANGIESYIIYSPDGKYPQ